MERLGFANEPSSVDWVIVAATVVIAISSVVSLGLTWRLSQDNRALRKAGTEPEVVAYLVPYAKEGACISLVLENVGQGPACDVEFFVDAEPKDFADHDVLSVTPRTTRKIRSLLPQGERIERLLGVGHRLFSDDQKAKLQPFCVTVSYSNLKGVRIGPKKYPLDIGELEGALGVSPVEKRLTDSVEKIERHLQHIASGFKRLHVETITTAERRAADEKRRACWEQESDASDVEVDGASP